MSSLLQFHSKESFPQILHLGETEQFGTLTINTKNLPKTDNQPIAIFFSIDVSGSMNDGDDYSSITKIDQVKRCMEQLVDLLSDNSFMRDIYIGIDVFNTKIEEIIEFIKLDESTASIIKKQIESIKCKSYTNIECCLKNAYNKIKHFQECGVFENRILPVKKMIHIMLTDGESTEGEANEKKLAKLVQPYIRNLFIGFGKEHNSFLLNALAFNGELGEYWFVDKTEKAGLVYGEMMYSILTSALEHISIDLDENTTVYNWKTGHWAHHLDIPFINAGTEKTFHIRRTPSTKIIVQKEETKKETETMEYGQISGVFQGTIIQDSLIPLPDLRNIQESLCNGQLCQTDLTEYMFRQKVQELLFVVRTMDTHQTTPQLMKQDLKKCYHQINKFIQQEKNTITNTDIDILPTKILFLTNLLDDLYICYKTIGTQHSHKFAVGRESSQGRQQTYNITEIDEPNNYGWEQISHTVNRNNDIGYSVPFDFGDTMDTSNDTSNDSIPEIIQHSLINQTPYFNKNQTSILKRFV